MTILDSLKGFWREHGNATSAAPIWSVRLGRDGITDDDLRARSDIDILPGVHYLQLAARRLNLRTDELFGTERFPVLHSQVIVDTTGGARIAFPAVAGRDSVGDLDIAASGRNAGASYPLTPVLPYHAGTLEMVAGVVSMKGDDAVARLSRVVNRVTGMIPPAVGVATGVQTVLGLANTALECVDDLFGLPDSKIVLGMHDLFAMSIGKRLRTGLFAVLNPRPFSGSGGTQLTDPQLLRFDYEELKYASGDGGAVALRDLDWFVLELSAWRHQPYTAFPELVKAYNDAVDALTTSAAAAKAKYNLAITLAAMSSQIVRSDREAVFSELRQDFGKAAAAMGVDLEPALTTRGAAEGDDGVLAAGEDDMLSFLVSV